MATIRTLNVALRMGTDGLAADAAKANQRFKAMAADVARAQSALNEAVRAQGARGPGDAAVERQKATLQELMATKKRLAESPLLSEAAKQKALQGYRQMQVELDALIAKQRAAGVAPALNDLRSAQQRLGLAKQLAAQEGATAAEKDKLADKVGRGTAAVIKFGVAVQAVNGALKVVTAGVAMYRGEWEKANDMMGQLPVGLGGVYRSMYDMVEAIDSFSDAYQRTQRVAEAAKQQQVFNAATKGYQQFIAEQQRIRTLLGSTGFGRERIQAQADFEASTAAMSQSLRDAQRSDLIPRMTAEAQKTLDARKADIAARETIEVNNRWALSIKSVAEAEVARRQAMQAPQEDQFAIRQQAMATVAQRTEELQTRLQMAAIGANDLDRALQALSVPGATAEELTRIRELMRSASAAEFAQREAEKLKTPVQQFREYRDQLALAVKAGTINQAQQEELLKRRMGELAGRSIDAGQGRQIRSDLIDWKALNMDKASPVVTELQDLLAESKRQTNIMLQQPDPLN
jgi:hypothetical protein